jgi:hypothetical protein
MVLLHRPHVSHTSRASSEPPSLPYHRCRRHSRDWAAPYATSTLDYPAAVEDNALHYTHVFKDTKYAIVDKVADEIEFGGDGEWQWEWEWDEEGDAEEGKWQWKYLDVFQEG